MSDAAHRDMAYESLMHNPGFPAQDACPFVERAKSEGYVTKDSGERAEYATGCVRDTTAGKGSFVSVSPHMLRRLAELLERGAIKYYLFNYQKGMPFSRCFDSLMRHTNQAFMGDKSEDHLAASIFNAMCLIHFEEEIAAGRLPAELNDLPRYQPTKDPRRDWDAAAALFNKESH